MMNLAQSAPTTGAGRTRVRLSPATFRKAGFAAAILLAPLILIPGTVFNPAIGGIGAGAANIAANASADPTTNQIHVYAYVVLSFLLPISAIGMSGLAIRRSPWLGTIGGALGIIGWLPFAALAAQDDLTFRMAEIGGGTHLVALWDRFTTDPTMFGFLLVYIVCHLVAYVILPVALWRGRYIPAWAAWALALTSPITIVGFATRQIALVGLVICGLLLIGSIPTAWAVWRSADPSAWPMAGSRSNPLTSPIPMRSSPSPVATNSEIS